MRKTLVYATLFSTAFLGSGAFAPAVAADNQPAPMKQDQAEPAKGVDANSQPSGINFVTMQDKGQWRAPKLIESMFTAPTTSRSARSTTS